MTHRTKYALLVLVMLGALACGLTVVTHTKIVSKTTPAYGKTLSTFEATLEIGPVYAIYETNSPIVGCRGRYCGTAPGREWNVQITISHVWYDRWRWQIER